MDGKGCHAQRVHAKWCLKSWDVNRLSVCTLTLVWRSGLWDLSVTSTDDFNDCTLCTSYILMLHMWRLGPLDPRVMESVVFFHTVLLLPGPTLIVCVFRLSALAIHAQSCNTATFQTPTLVCSNILAHFTLWLVETIVYFSHTFPATNWGRYISSFSSVAPYHDRSWGCKDSLVSRS